MDGIKAREKDYAAMDAYSGDSRCVKCGGLEASTALKKKSLFGFIEGGNSWELFTDTAYEVMERRCPKCGHTWEEKPLDVSRNEVTDIAKVYHTIHQPNVETSEKPIDLKKLNEDYDPKQDTPYSFNENNHPWSWFIDGGFAENLVTGLRSRNIQSSTGPPVKKAGG